MTSVSGYWAWTVSKRRGFESRYVNIFVVEVSKRKKKYVWVVEIRKNNFYKNLTTQTKCNERIKNSTKLIRTSGLVFNALGLFPKDASSNPASLNFLYVFKIYCFSLL